MCDPQAKPVGINCVVQQSVDAEPLGSNPVNAAELQERCVRTLCMRRAKQCLGLNATSADVAQVAVRQPWGVSWAHGKLAFTLHCVSFRWIKRPTQRALHSPRL